MMAVVAHPGMLLLLFASAVLEASGLTVRPGADLQAEVDRAIAAGAPSRVVVHGADYVFNGSSLVVAGARDLTLVVGTTGPSLAPEPLTLWFDCGFGVHVANSSGVTFQGFTIDYVAPCHAQGTITALHPVPPGVEETPGATGVADVDFDIVNFPPPTGPLFPPGTNEQPWPPVTPPLNHVSVKVAFWDPQTTQMVAHGNHMFTNVSHVGGSKYRVLFSGASVSGIVEPGFLLTVHYRLGLTRPNAPGMTPIRTPGGLTYLITNSSGVTTANLTVHGGATEAVVEGGGEGGHVYRGVRVVRRPGRTPVRLLAANADGFHSSCVRRGPQLLDSEISFTGDDLLNIHSRLSLVLAVLDGGRAAYIVDAVGSSSPADYDDSTLMLQQTAPGDVVAFWTLEALGAVGSGEVTAIERRHGPEYAKMATKAYIDVNNKPYSQNIRHNFGARVWLVNWTAPVASLAYLDVVDVPRLRPQGAIIRGNHLHDSYGRFGLYDSPGAVIEGNTFEFAAPLYVGESGVGWLEGPAHVSNVRVVGNTFRDYAGRGVAINWAASTSNVTQSDNKCFLKGAETPCH